MKIRRMALAGFTYLIVLQWFVDFDIWADFEDESGPKTVLVKKRQYRQYRVWKWWRRSRLSGSGFSIVTSATIGQARMIIGIKGADWRNDCDNKSGQTSPFCAYFLRHSIQLENSAIWRLLVSITDLRDIIARVRGKNFKRSPIDFSSSYFSLIASSKVGELELRQKALRNGQSVGVVIFHHGSHIYIWQEALAWWMWHWIH